MTTKRYMLRLVNWYTLTCVLCVQIDMSSRENSIYEESLLDHISFLQKSSECTLANTENGQPRRRMIFQREVAREFVSCQSCGKGFITDSG